MPQLVVETQPDSVGTPPAEPTPVAPRSPRGYVVLTIGLPGSGKTTWYKRRGVTPLSSDMLRNILFDDITEQRYQGLVFSTLRSLLRARLIAKMPWNYVDATNLSPHERRQWIKMAKSFGYEVQAVFFDVPLSVCLERNSKRDRQVTDEVMHKMAERLRPPAFKEGFDKITVVRVKGATHPTPVAEPDGPDGSGGAAGERRRPGRLGLGRSTRDAGDKMATGGVEFADVSFTLPSGRQLLSGVSLRCEPGTTTALLGRSGSGKTTLLRTVNGLVRASSGRVLVNGADVAQSDPLKLRHGIGYVIQESGLFPHMSIERNVALPLELMGETSRSEMRARAASGLKRVGLDEDLIDRYPWELSGGQRQRVGLARALVAAPSTLLMDEPFGALDPLTRAEMQTMVRELLRGSEVTTLVVTHDLPEALFLAERVVLIDAGKVIANVAAAEVMHSSEPALQAYVRASQPRVEAA